MVFSILNNLVNTRRGKQRVFRPLVCTYASAWNCASQLMDGWRQRKGGWQMNVRLVSRSEAAFVDKCLCLCVLSSQKVTFTFSFALERPAD